MAYKSCEVCSADVYYDEGYPNVNKDLYQCTGCGKKMCCPKLAGGFFGKWKCPSCGSDATRVGKANDVYMIY
jgi:hypothetical protein